MKAYKKTSHDYTWKGTICQRTVDSSDGQDEPTYTMLIGDIWFKRMMPLRGNETSEGTQTVAVQRDTWETWDLSNLVQIKATDLIIINGKGYHITGIRPLKGSRDKMLFDTELRDNAATYEIDESGMVRINMDLTPIEQI